jgi:hypothetical protein
MRKLWTLAGLAEDSPASVRPGNAARHRARIVDQVHVRFRSSNPINERHRHVECLAPTVEKQFVAVLHERGELVVTRLILDEVR